MTLTNIFPTDTGGGGVGEGNGYLIRNVQGRTLYIFDGEDSSTVLEAVVLEEMPTYLILDRMINLPSRSFASLSP